MPLALAEMQLERHEDRTMSWLQNVMIEPHYWALPEFLRLQAKLVSGIESEAMLTRAFEIARQSGSALWLERLNGELVDFS